jgi:hypothetical protein
MVAETLRVAVVSYPQITQRGLGRTNVLVLLQRSRMFIENGFENDPRSSGAQCFPEWYASRASVSLRWSEEESFGARACYNISSLAGRGAMQNVGRRHKSRQKNMKLSVCFTDKICLIQLRRNSLHSAWFSNLCNLRMSQDGANIRRPCFASINV